MSVLSTPLLPADVAVQDYTMAPLIAIVGCDGSGKTTLATELCNSLAWREAVYCYLGLGSRTIAAKIETWPLIGKLLVKRCSSKAKQARTKGERIPGPLTALIIYAFSLLRLRRFKRMLALRKQGHLVISDRYPQLDIAGFYDGPGLSAARASGPFTAWIARRERALYERMVKHLPTVVIRLNVAAQTAYDRKPDHELPLLRQKVEVTPLLTFNGATIVDIDANQPYKAVRAEVWQVVQRVLNAHAQRQMVSVQLEDELAAIKAA